MKTIAKNLMVILTVLLMLTGFAMGQTIATYDFAEPGAVTGLDEASPGIAVDLNIGFGSFKNSSTSNPAIYYGQLRLYQNATMGGSIKIYANNGVTITQVVVHASDRTGPAAFTVDGGAATDLSGGTTYTMSSLSATSVVEFYQKDGDSGNRIYVDDFEVTYTSGGSPDPEPTNYVTSFSAISDYESVDLSWSDNDGAQAAAGFLIKASTTSLAAITAPLDETVVSDDTDLSDGSGTVNVGHGVEEYSWTGLDEETTYYFKIYPFTNSGSDIDYKTDGTTPSVTQATTANPWDYTEAFTNFPETGTSYNTGTFTGIDGSTWNYVKCAGGSASAITSPTPVLGKDQDPAAQVYSGSLLYGVKQLGFEYKQAFSTNVNLEVYVNDTKVYTATSTSESGVLKYSGVIDVNINEVSVIKFIQPSGGGQVSIDNVKWSNMSDTPLPITLTSFTATAKNGAVELAWETATETNNARFVIYRNGEAIGSVEGAGTTSEPNSYRFVDNTVIPGITYTYVLADVDYANKETKYETEAVTVTVNNDIVEADFVVGAAYPNPFNPTAIVPVELSRDAMVKASLYDLNGREVKTLVNTNVTAGTHELHIDGSGLTTGLYLVQVVVEDVINVQKIALMK